MFVVAAKEGKQNGIKEARKYLDNLGKDWTLFPLTAIEGGELDKRLVPICEDLAKKGYDAKRARFGFYFKE